MGKKNSGDGNGNGDGNGDDAKGRKKLTMTQEELNNMMGDRADRAKKSATGGMLTDLGFEDNMDGLKGALEEWQAAKDGEKTDLEKAQGDLETSSTRVGELETELSDEKKRAETYMLRMSVMSAARDADFLKESLEDVWLLVSTTEDLSSAVKVNGEKVEGAEGVVKKVAELRPHWVEQKQRSTTPPGRSNSTPPAGKRKASEDPEESLVNF
jgi:hypothetical protein